MDQKKEHEQEIGYGDRWRLIFKSLSKQPEQKPERTEIAPREKKAIENEVVSDPEIKKKTAEARNIEEKNEDRRANRDLRTKYANKVFRYLSYYSLAVLFLLLLSGFGLGGFNLPDMVLSFLVGSTAVSAIGLVLAVTNGLFGRDWN